MQNRLSILVIIFLYTATTVISQSCLDGKNHLPEPKKIDDLAQEVCVRFYFIYMI